MDEMKINIDNQIKKLYALKTKNVSVSANNSKSAPNTTTAFNTQPINGGKPDKLKIKDENIVWTDLGANFIKPKSLSCENKEIDDVPFLKLLIIEIVWIETKAYAIVNRNNKEIGKEGLSITNESNTKSDPVCDMEL